MSGNITVAVRVRPLNEHERTLNDPDFITIRGAQVILEAPEHGEHHGRRLQSSEPKIFAFDHAYDSMHRDAQNYADQTRVFEDLGLGLLDGALQGYNCCILAYGQTGSGKSYSMMGTESEQGMIPTICEALLSRIQVLQEHHNDVKCSIEVSYYEIYSEKVRDLLSSTGKKDLRVREHPITGPYVEGLCRMVVGTYSEIDSLLSIGNMQRTVAATNMNETSSRSHAVFNVILNQRSIYGGVDVEKVSKISLVDLAGSERARRTGAIGTRLKEGADINKSLSTLGRVISVLAQRHSRGQSSATSVPYRDSTLTWLLKDSLGGNSLTAMLATISPAAINYEETLSTLRYADAAKKIQNHAVINEDQNTKMIRELKEELETLRARLSSQPSPSQAPSIDDQLISFIGPNGTTKLMSKVEIARRMEQSTRLIEDLNLSWEDRLHKTREIHREREKALEDLGIQLDKGLLGLSSPRKMPHLINLSEDPLLDELLVYNLKRGETRCGSANAGIAEVRLSCPSIKPVHCSFVNDGRTVILKVHHDATVLVDDLLVKNSVVLSTGQRVICGDEGLHVFKYTNPTQARELRVDTGAKYVNVPTRTRRTQDSPSIDQRDISMDDIMSVNEFEQSDSLEHLDQPLETAGSDHTGSVSSQSGKDAVSVTTVTSEAIDLYHAQLGCDVIATSENQSEQLLGDTQSSRKRASDTEKILQEFNASRLLSEVRGSTKKTSLIDRLRAVHSDAQNELRSNDSSLHQLSYMMQRSLTQQQRLVLEFVQRWRQSKFVNNGRQLLEAAYALKEAQILCTQLNQNLNFQFAITGCSIAFISPLESDDVYESLSQDTTHVLANTACQVMVRVIDLNRGILLFWPLDKLKTRTKHIKKNIPSRNTPSKSKNLQYLGRTAPLYSVLGVSTVPIVLSTHGEASRLEVDVYSPYTTIPIAVLTLTLGTFFDEVKQQCTINLHIHSVCGLADMDQLTDVHIHAYLESVPEVRLTTQVASTIKHDMITFSSRHTCSVAVEQLPDVLCFELYGNAQPAFLGKMLSWDNLQENYAITGTRRPFVIPIISEIQICELDTTGSYATCEVISNDADDPGFFCLHQGLSRRIVVSISCASIESMQSATVVDIVLSNVIPSKSSNEDCISESVQLKLISASNQQPLAETSKAHLKVIAQWDSSMHNTEYLDRTTALDTMVLVRASIELVMNGDTHRLVTTLPLKIYGREEQPGFFSRLLSWSRTLPCLTRTFAIPCNTKEESDAQKLMRWSSANQYQRGQEVLRDWQPRGLSLLQNHEMMQRKRAAAMAVIKTKMQYSKQQLSISTSKAPPSRDYIRDIVEYWQKITRRNRDINLEARVLASFERNISTRQIDSINFSPTVKSNQFIVSNNRSGIHKQEGDQRRFCTLRLPYLLRYLTSTLATLESVTDLTSATVHDSSPTTFVIESNDEEILYVASSETVQREWVSLISNL